MENNGDIIEIMNLLPHRYPFLLVDKILEFEDSKSITAIKNVSFNLVQKYYGQYFQPSEAYLVVLGDVDVAAVKTLVEKLFSPWEVAPVEIPVLPEPRSNPEQLEINFIDMIVLPPKLL